MGIIKINADKILAKKRQAITDERFRRETLGIRVNGRLYATDDRSKILIPGVADLADNSESQDEMRSFKTADSNGVAVYYDLPVWEAIQVKRLGGEYIQKCFDEERRLIASLDKGEEATPNWPEREYTITRSDAVARRLTRAEMQKRIKALEAAKLINVEVASGVTVNGSAVIQLSKEYTNIIDVSPKISWNGQQAVIPYEKSRTSTTITLGAKQTRSTLLLSAGPMQEAPNGTPVSALVIGS